ncbi:flagellar biosynthesis repressor FlbT [Algicella marina]|uniref:Flagellar biosynthesis repressor FlbT n=1 Tax=Algicella marina TaxID=2683284 RepID=A0A6P1T789_9RHOB|nr:flagellar biosynthesis repressor FlbT [Algicella marina]QHQ36442.1 flagellar biosynthesis repressor FlbT [Algicella marina]
MSGLVLKLGPRERVMINGVVMENGDRRTRLNVITPDANVLRLRDAIHPEEAVTPVKRTCYVAQMILAGEADAEEGRRQLLTGIEQLSQVFTDHESRAHLDSATKHVLAGKIYPALRSLRNLIARESRLFGQGGMA